MRRGGRFLAAAAIAVLLVTGASAAGPPAWTTYGGDPGRTGAASAALSPPLKPAFVLPLRGRVTSQVLAARDVPSAGLTTLYVTTSAGLVYAVSETGYVRWRVDLGQLANDCPQLDGYGVTGTPVIDAAARRCTRPTRSAACTRSRSRPAPSGRGGRSSSSTIPRRSSSGER